MSIQTGGFSEGKQQELSLLSVCQCSSTAAALVSLLAADSRQWSHHTCSLRSSRKCKKVILFVCLQYLSLSSLVISLMSIWHHKCTLHSSRKCTRLNCYTHLSLWLVWCQSAIIFSDKYPYKSNYPSCHLWCQHSASITWFILLHDSIL